LSPALKARSWASRLTSECDTIMAVLAPAQSHLTFILCPGKAPATSPALRQDRTGAGTARKQRVTRGRRKADTPVRAHSGGPTSGEELAGGGGGGGGGGRLWRGAGGGRLWRLGTEPFPPLGSGGELWREGVELCEGGGDGGGLAQGETEIREGCEGGRDVEA